MQVAIESIASSIDFIENHLKDDIAVGDIADSVSYSIYHFCRTFNRVTHHTPYNYLTRRRLSAAACDLIKSDQNILEIAIDYQFHSHEAYSRAFKRMFTIQPIQWRKEGNLNSRLLMPRLTRKHLDHLHRGRYLQPEFIEQDAIHLSGIMSRISNDATQVHHLWQILAREMEAVIDRESNVSCYGVTSYLEDQDAVFYMAAVETGLIREDNLALVTRRIPAGTYASFVHKGLYPALYLTRDYIYHTWIYRAGVQLAYPLEIEFLNWNQVLSDMATNERQILVPLA